MTYFQEYVSNTTAGTSNQSLFPGGEGVSRVFYRLLWGGTEHYSLLFSNTLDSTFADGTRSCANQLCGPWSLSVSCCVCQGPEDPGLETGVWTDVTFDGALEKSASPGELFSTDAFPLTVRDGEYLCVQIRYRGDRIPCHPEINIPSYRKQADRFVLCEDVPVPSMVGCRRDVKMRIGFLGDSITQGIGTAPDSYGHWCHSVMKRLGPGYAGWNLGIGYGRASDAASQGIWLEKALQNDCVVVCFGINDIVQGDGDKLSENLEHLVNVLKSRGKKVILQSIPPFDFVDQKASDLWEAHNHYIRHVLAPKCDGYLDVATFLSVGGAGQTTKYGGHPNEEGCAVWAEHLLPVLRDVLGIRLPQEGS